MPDLPAIGSKWVLALAPKTVGIIAAIESPPTTAHEYTIQVDADDPEAKLDLSFSLGLGEFKKTWIPFESRPPVGDSVWDRLIRDDDLV